LVVPPAQTKLQTPPEQTWPLAQALPQPPQLAGSLVVVTQAEPHKVVPPAQVTPHLLAEQACPVAQGVVQLPQYAESLVMLTHEVPHLVVPPAQTKLQTPLEQT
jgi:hypothetical protein